MFILSNSSDNYIEPNGERLPDGFAYNSNTNTEWLSKHDIENFLKNNSNE